MSDILDNMSVADLIAAHGGSAKVSHLTKVARRPLSPGRRDKTAERPIKNVPRL
jgi:hypothetical protein